MNVYVASKYQNRDACAALAGHLRALGCDVTSRWHEGPAQAVPESELPDDALDAIAADNHADLARADALVLLVHPGLAGSLLETGVAIGRGMPLLVVGPQRGLTLMARHRLVTWVDDADAAVAVVGRWTGRTP